MMPRRLLLAVVPAGLCASADAAAENPGDTGRAAFRALYQELVEIDSSVSTGSTWSMRTARTGSATAGATIGRHLLHAGIPTYGLSGMFSVPGEENAHGVNEKIRVQSVYQGREFLEMVTRAYSRN